MLLCDVRTDHIYFVSNGYSYGEDIFAVEGELHLPGEFDNSWWELNGEIQDGRWVWDGNGNPIDFNGNAVLMIVAFDNP